MSDRGSIESRVVVLTLEKREVEGYLKRNNGGMFTSKRRKSASDLPNIRISARRNSPDVLTFGTTLNVAMQKRNPDYPMQRNGRYNWINTPL